MNVYDFDGTIYRGDSSVDFYLFSLKANPSLVRFIPKQLYGGILYTLKKIDKTRFKEFFFCFLQGIDANLMVKRFWIVKKRKINKWYLKQKKSDDIIISASPEFLLRPICSSMGIERVIATKVDIKTGHFRSLNCKGIEKVNRLKKECHIDEVDEFYSDSLSDYPIAHISKRAYRVINGTVTKWNID